MKIVQININLPVIVTKFILPILFSVSLFTNVRGQSIDVRHKSRDTTYIKDLYDNFVLRVYECTKFNNFKLIDGNDKLIFKQNHHNDLGFGFNYKILFLNIEFTIPSTEKDRSIYGTTTSFDVQTYVYIKKFVVDFYTQFYHGYYLSNNDELVTGSQPAEVLVRPDIKTVDLSLNIEYVPNNSRFSFNAPFTQNEIQKKSAGSFLMGGGIYHLNGKADSTFVPAMIKKTDFFQNHHVRAFSYTSIGCNIGYGYTQVIKKDFYIIGAISGGPGIGYSALKYDPPYAATGKVGIAYNATAKFGTGWNSAKYFVGLTYIRLFLENNSVVQGTREESNTGNFQFTVARRFVPKRSLIPRSGLIKIY
jgi:hypothetical protein